MGTHGMFLAHSPTAFNFGEQTIDSWFHQVYLASRIGGLFTLAAILVPSNTKAGAEIDCRVCVHLVCLRTGI